MEPTRIDDPDDPRLDDYRALTDPELRKRYEGERGVFIVESALAVEALSRSPHAPATRSVLVGERRIDRLRPVIDALAVTGASILTAPAAVMEATAGFPLHRGVVAAVDRPAPLDPAAVLRGARLVLAIEGVNDHENLGALFRNAAAFGVDAVLLDPRCADPWYRRCVRVSMGHVLAVPHARTPPWPDGLVAALGDHAATDTATDAGTGSFGPRLLALSPGASMPLGAVEVDHRPNVVVVGAEGPGLDRATLDHPAVEPIRIPMAPGVDSLNVATAAAVALAHLTSDRYGTPPTG